MFLVRGDGAAAPGSSSSSSSSCREYRAELDGACLCGEVVRNACVNLGVVPETCGGVTLNVRVSRRHGTEPAARWCAWEYAPNATLADAGLCDGERILLRTLARPVAYT